MTWNVSDMQKTPTQKTKMKHIYIFIITGVNDNIKQQRYTIFPPQLRLKCAQGRDYINNKAGTFTQEHCSVFVGRWLQCSPAAPCIEVLHLFRWYTHTQRQTYIHTLHYITLHYIALHCIALHCIALHYITLHYITYITYKRYIFIYLFIYLRIYLFIYVFLMSFIYLCTS